jgi:hypothetical protein
VTPADDGGETTPAGDETPDDNDTDNGSAPSDDGTNGAPAGGEPERDADGAPVASSGATDGPAGESADGALTAGSASPGSDEDSAASSDGLLTMVLFAGLSGVAAVALIGTALMLAGRRRARDDEPEVPVGATAGANTEALPAGAAAGDILGRRMLRQARVRMTDDPIVAALGIGNEDDDRRRARRKAGQVGRGPGERPNIVRH